MQRKQNWPVSYCFVSFLSTTGRKICELLCALTMQIARRVQVLVSGCAEILDYSDNELEPARGGSIQSTQLKRRH
jgi:hypothetical protein